MLLGRIASVCFPAVVRKFLADLPHKGVTVSFGQYRGSSNRIKKPIATYNALVRHIPISIKTVAIDQQKLRPYCTIVQCSVHGQERSVQNIDLIDFLIAHLRHSPANSFSLNLLLQQFSLDRKSTRLNSSHVKISYAVFCLKK